MILTTLCSGSVYCMIQSDTLSNLSNNKSLFMHLFAFFVKIAHFPHDFCALL